MTMKNLILLICTLLNVQMLKADVSVCGIATIEYNQEPFSVKCNVEANKTDCDSGNILFYLKRHQTGEHINITEAINIKKRTTRPSDRDIVCEYFNHSIRMRLKPSRHIQNFKCLSKWGNTTCSFDKNIMDIRDDFMYRVSVDRTNRFTCDVKTMNNKKICQITTTHHIEPNVIYDIEVMASSLEGYQVSYNKSIDPKYIEILNPVKSLKILENSLTQLTISFETDTNMPIIYKIQIICDCITNKIWTNIQPQLIQKNEMYHELKFNMYDLIFNMNYSLRIQIQIENAIYPDDQWSDFKIVNFTTVANRPFKSPTIDFFEYINDDQLNIFWEPLSQDDWNGKDFHYEIIQISENNTTDRKITYSNSSSIIVHSNPNTGYTFQIFSKNINGTSNNYTQIYIPPKNLTQRSPTPKNSRIIKLDDGTLKLVWKYPSKFEPDDYNIFHCTSKDEQQTSCENLINKWTLSGTTTILKLNTTHSHDSFAISTVVNGQPSGIEWFTCKTSSKNNMTLISNLNVENINSTSANISWILPCNVTIHLKKFIVSYCETKDRNNLECPTGNLTIVQLIPFDDGIYEYTVKITNLKPFKEYLVTISMHDNVTHGPVTNKIFETNFINPLPPYNLSTLMISNDSIWLSWSQPLEWNGIKFGYEVYYNNKTKIIQESNGFLPTDLLLKKLDPSKLYQISIRATNKNRHGVKLNSETKHATFFTQSGNPQPPINLTESKNNSLLIYTWKPPTNSSQISFYEVTASVLENGELLTVLLGIVNSTTCTLEKDPCTTGQSSFKFSVRSVNVVKEISNKSSHYNAFQPNTISKKFVCRNGMDQDFVEQITKDCANTVNCYASDYVKSFVDCGNSIIAAVTIGSIIVAIIIGCILLCMLQSPKDFIGNQEFDITLPINFFEAENSERDENNENIIIQKNVEENSDLNNLPKQ